MRRADANLCACACAAAAAGLAGLGACGGDGGRREAAVADGTYRVAIERASFPARQRLAQPSELVITVRNSGSDAIPNLTLTVRGFSDRPAGSRDADPARDVWIVDEGPAAARTAFADTWAAGPLAPGARATLRWRVTPVVSGRHAVSYAIGAAVRAGRATLVGGGVPRGSLPVTVTDAPAQARVDPRTGAVIRQE